MEYKSYSAEYANGVKIVALEAWQNTYKDIFDNVFINEFVDRNYSPSSLNSSLDRIAKDREFFELAIDNGKVIGFCNIGDRGDGWELFRIYISPHYLGKGTGKTLSIHGEQFLKSKEAASYFCF